MFSYCLNLPIAIFLIMIPFSLRSGAIFPSAFATFSFVFVSPSILGLEPEVQNLSLSLDRMSLRLKYSSQRRPTEIEHCPFRRRSTNPRNVNARSVTRY